MPTRSEPNAGSDHEENNHPLDSNTERPASRPQRSSSPSPPPPLPPSHIVQPVNGLLHKLSEESVACSPARKRYGKVLKSLPSLPLTTPGSYVYSAPKVRLPRVADYFEITFFVLIF